MADLAPVERATRRSWLPRSLTLRVVVTYLGLRAVTTILLALAVRAQVPVLGWTGPHVDYFGMTVLWDGTWYRHIAESGYPMHLPLDATGKVAQNTWAFFPAFPLLARLVMTVTGLSFPVVGSTLALVCGLGAAILMARLLARRVPAGVALGAVAVWAAFPSSPSLQLAYTESAAILLLCAFLLLVIDEHWALAGVVALAMGLTRPIAAPLGLVLGVALALRWRRRGERHVSLLEWWSALAGLALCAASIAAWPAIAWLVTGDRAAYASSMASWRVGHQLKFFTPWLSIATYVMRDTSHPRLYGWVALATIAVTLLTAVLGPWASRLGPEMRTWCLAYPAYLAAVLDPFTSIVRYLLPLFPLALVLVGGGRREGRSSWWSVRTVVFVGLGVLGQIWWIWHLLVFVPPSDYPP